MTDDAIDAADDYGVEVGYGQWIQWAGRYRQLLTLAQRDALDAKIAARMAAEEAGAAAAPVLTSLVPNQATLGTPSFTLRVLGTGFTAASVIVWNGAPEPTTYVSSTEVTTGVNMATAEVAMAIPVEVDTAGARSNTLPFELRAP